MCPWRGRSEGARRARAASRSKGRAGATVPQPCPIERGRTTGTMGSHRAQVRARVAATTELDIVGGLAWAIETPPIYRGSCSGVPKPPSRARTRVTHVVPRSTPAAPRLGGRGEFTQTAWRSIVLLPYSAHDYGARSSLGAVIGTALMLRRQHRAAARADPGHAVLFPIGAKRPDASGRWNLGRTRANAEEFRWEPRWPWTRLRELPADLRSVRARHQTGREWLCSRPAPR